MLNFFFLCSTSFSYAQSLPCSLNFFFLCSTSFFFAELLFLTSSPFLFFPCLGAGEGGKARQACMFELARRPFAEIANLSTAGENFSNNMGSISMIHTFVRSVKFSSIGWSWNVEYPSCTSGHAWNPRS